jgi:hypothetical protein
MSKAGDGGDVAIVTVPVQPDTIASWNLIRQLLGHGYPAAGLVSGTGQNTLWC